MTKLKIKRVYVPPEGDDGARILVDRLWPRGLSKNAARIDRWVKDVAPSNSLRNWFGHDPAKWEEFRRRYIQELRNNRGSVTSIQELLRGEAVTLLYGARDEKHNNAVVLKEYLKGGKAPAPVRKVRHLHKGAATHR